MNIKVSIFNTISKNEIRISNIVNVVWNNFEDHSVPNSWFLIDF